jgi:hypothetical protein
MTAPVHFTPLCMSCSKQAHVLSATTGIAEGGGHVHVMYIYRNPESTAPFDDSMSMTFKLPVRDEE